MLKHDDQSYICNSIQYAFKSMLKSELDDGNHCMIVNN